MLRNDEQSALVTGEFTNCTLSATNRLLHILDISSTDGVNGRSALAGDMIIWPVGRSVALAYAGG